MSKRHLIQLVDEIPVPPESYMRLVCGHQPNIQELFEQRGREIVARLQKHGLLHNGARLLDIGCGCGRVARHLLDVPDLGTYEGFDRHPGMIAWCDEHLAKRDPRFNFRFVDLESIYRNIDGHAGSLSAETFRFPYENASFDGALAASVFTHLQFPEMLNYLAELRRVLVPSGVALVTVFFSSDDTPRQQGHNFFYPRDGFLDAVEHAGFRYQTLENRPGSPQNWIALMG